MTKHKKLSENLINFPVKQSSIKPLRQELENALDAILQMRAELQSTKQNLIKVRDNLKNN